MAISRSWFRYLYFRFRAHTLACDFAIEASSLALYAYSPVCFLNVASGNSLRDTS